MLITALAVLGLYLNPVCAFIGLGVLFLYWKSAKV